MKQRSIGSFPHDCAKHHSLNQISMIIPKSDSEKLQIATTAAGSLLMIMSPKRVSRSLPIFITIELSSGVFFASMDLANS
jgi:hypothetical protein